MANIEGPGAPLEVRARAADGRWIHVEVITTNLLDDERFGGHDRVDPGHHDRRDGGAARASAERVLDHTFAHNPIGMVLCTADGRFVKVNPAFCELVGLTEAELLADTYQGLTDRRGAAPRSRTPWSPSSAASRRASRPTSASPARTARVRIGELTVSMVEDPDGVRLIFGQLRDVTDQRELQRELEHRSLHDPLTGLANRALFADRVEPCPPPPPSLRQRPVGAFVDLDDFKTVNDALGHAGGRRAARAGWPSGSRTRPGHRHRGPGRRRRVRASCWTRAGSAGRRRATWPPRSCELFDEPVHRRRPPAPGRGQRRHRLDGDRPERRPRRRGAGGRRRPRHVRGQAGGQGAMACLPAVDALPGRRQPRHPGAAGARLPHRGHRGPLPAGGRHGDRSPVGLEALARWRHPSLGLLRPGEFLDVAEEMGLASALDWCVLERVALDRERWQRDRP